MIMHPFKNLLKLTLVFCLEVWRLGNQAFFKKAVSKLVSVGQVNLSKLFETLGIFIRITIRADSCTQYAY